MTNHGEMSRAKRIAGYSLAAGAFLAGELETGTGNFYLGGGERTSASSDQRTRTGRRA